MIYYSDLNGCGATLEKASEGSFGYDLRALQGTLIPPGEIWPIATGICLDLSKSGAMALVLSRSGLASKGVMVANAPGLIDADYRGEIKVLLWNAMADEFRVKAGDRIAQLIFVEASPFVPMMPTAIQEAFRPTKRGAGGFGSTGLH